MLPVITLENLTRPFKFYFEGAIHEGLTYRGSIYKLVKTFAGHQRSQAYELGCQLSNQDDRVVITINPQTSVYRIWVDVRSSIPMERSSFCDQIGFPSLNPLTPHSAVA